MHAWDDSVPDEETLRTFHDLIRNDKVRYIGASNLKGWQLQKLMDISKYMGLPPVISLQVIRRLFEASILFKNIASAMSQGY